jgi:TonB-linked SusC/RagA family outer membrane protein
MKLNNHLKISLIILLLSTSILNTLAQNGNRISVDLQGNTLQEFFNLVENKTNYSFAFSNEDIDVEAKVYISNNDISLIAALDSVLIPLQIRYHIIGSQIILKKEEISQRNKVNQQVSGKIYSKADSMPLPGVNILIKGTERGTVSNKNGSFKFEDIDNEKVLEISYLGFKSVELLITPGKEYAIWLDESLSIIDEVIVIGYGQENKRILSSSVSNIKSKELTRIFTSNISEALKGKVTGLMVNQNSGTPGAASTMRIRGVSSITAGATPLYIIDGVPVIARDLSQITFNGQSVNTISDININDIESISILKDASATAIYGARGSNGVVLITTKRGKANESHVQFNARYGIQQVANSYDMLNAEQYMRYKNDAAINSNGVAIYTEEEISNNTIDTDWQKELYRLASIQSYDLSFSGGNTKTRYYIIGSYFDQEGIVEGTDYSRFSGRINLDQNVKERLELGASIAINKSVSNRKEGDQSLNGPVPNAISLPPIYPVYNPDGSFNDDAHLANPISIAKHHTNVMYSWNNLGNIFLNFKLSTHFSSKTKLGFDYINFREHTYDPATTRQGAKYQGLGIESSSEALKTLASQLFEYKQVFGSLHVVNAIAGVEFDREVTNLTYMRGESFASEKLEYLANAVEKVSAEVYFNEAVLNSFLGRINYKYNNRYILNLNGRYDGSSRFSKQNRYGFFPSGDIAWRISDESFFSSSVLSDLKLRASYGKTGNDNIPDFLFLSQFGAGEYADAPAIYSINIPNPDLKWETTWQTNLGIDFSLFQDRIEMSFDYYKKKTEDLLLQSPVPPSSGYTQVVSNIGKMENTGFEIYLRSLNINKTLTWTSEISLSANQNKVTELYNGNAIENIGRGFQRIEVGEPIGIFYGYNSLGVDPSTGDLVFEDVNKDGEIDVEDKKRIGSPHALVHGGFLNNFSYRNFELNIFLQYSYGNDVFNGTRRYIESMKDANNQTTAILNRWRKPGDVTDMPRATNADPNENNRVSSRFVEDGSYLKIKTIRFSYTFSNKINNAIGIEQLQLYFLGQNLFTLTNFSGMDPEVNYAGDDVIRSGVEFFTYPPAKIYSVGLTIQF